MNRREILIGVAVGALSRKVAAQESTIHSIGFLHSASPQPNVALVNEFKKGLFAGGYIEGRNITIEYRWADGRLSKLGDLASDLVTRNVSVIATPGSTPAAIAAKSATVKIPIVFAVGGNPVTLGLVESLNRPGKNVTGIGFESVEIAGKSLGILRELLPKAYDVVAVVNPRTEFAAELSKRLQAGAAASGFHLEIREASSEPQLRAAFEQAAQKAIPVVVGPDALYTSLRRSIVQLAAKYSVPTMYVLREFAMDGGLISYGPDLANAYREAGVYVSRVLKGENPASMPVSLPTRYILAINTNTAKSLNISIPDKLLALADEVIE